MTISDSNPIQFWPIAGSTFNEEVVCGLNRQDCFCQHWECNDDVPIQFQDTTYNGYDVTVHNEDDHTLDTYTISQTAVNGVWAGTLNLNTLCDLSPAVLFQRVKFILNGLRIANTTFASGSITPWISSASFDGRSGTVATTVAIGYVQLNTNGFNLGLILHQDKKFFRAGETITFRLNFIVAGTAGTINLLLIGWDGGANRLWIFNGAGAPGENPGATGSEPFANGTYSIVRTFTITHNYTDLYIQAAASGVGNANAKFSLISIDTNEDQYYKSDCQEIKMTQSCTKLITYTNSSNFDDLVYTGIMPTPSFNLRFPALMYKSKNPKEQEDLELSNGVVVTLRSSIQQKKMFEHGFIPDYMVLKLQKILMHETITIDGTQWKQRDPYDDKQVDKYNLKTGSVLLTKYNSVEKNTI